MWGEYIVLDRGLELATSNGHVITGEHLSDDDTKSPWCLDSYSPSLLFSSSPFQSRARHVSIKRTSCKEEDSFPFLSFVTHKRTLSHLSIPFSPRTLVTPHFSLNRLWAHVHPNGNSRNTRSLSLSLTQLTWTD
jgi:hypothetical protein